MTGQCVCGEVSVTLDAAPEYINDCNCSLCRKVGGAWGYFKSASVTTTGRTVSVIRKDKESPVCEIHSCATCASTTHFVLTEAYREKNPTADLVGANMRLFNSADLTGVEVRFPNGKDWPGEGAFEYRRPSIRIGHTGEW
ncbi:MAG: hypothetical protein V2I66_05015 [Halieaceae bacterium]|jgi:hypothetical protein|nr:hypothetical protein [Halieaceae bacterium]